MQDPSRRAFLRSLAAAAAAAPPPGRLWAGQAPAIVTSPASRPSIAQGVAAGDVGNDGAVIWSRTDRPARMWVEYATTDSFAAVTRLRGPAALESTDFTARATFPDLPRGQRIFYRVQFQDLADLRGWSEAATGSFRTPPAAGPLPRDVRLAWSADTVGQGWGINPDWGGLRLYETMRAAEPDLFVHCGDTIYADQPLVAEVTLDDGTIWKNVVTPAKAKAAETLDEFRGNYQYNLLDEHMRRFNAEVPQVVIWDDHEVRDNWYETRDLSRDARYQVKSAALLAARARQAFVEYNPLPIQADHPERIHRSVGYGDAVEVFAIDLRSYRAANSENTQIEPADATRLFGERQMRWLQERLAASRATWKVIASDLPIGLVVPDGRTHFEAIANAQDGPPRGREFELAGLLRFIHDRRVRNVVWITADVHYCAAHHYSPSRAHFTSFDPFWEFVAGPLHAGTFGPNALDATFGPEVRFNGVPEGMTGNRPPSEGLQFFGTLTVDRRTRVLAARLHDLSGKALFSVDLAPRG